VREVQTRDMSTSVAVADDKKLRFPKLVDIRYDVVQSDRVAINATRSKITVSNKYVECHYLLLGAAGSPMIVLRAKGSCFWMK
jgi:hypothetical protein